MRRSVLVKSNGHFQVLSIILAILIASMVASCDPAPESAKAEVEKTESKSSKEESDEAKEAMKKKQEGMAKEAEAKKMRNTESISSTHSFAPTSPGSKKR